MRVPRALAALAALSFACSDSRISEIEAPLAQPSSLLVVFDTSAGTDVELRGFLGAVALEDEDGQLTPNLAPDRPSVQVTHPLGHTSGVDLSEVPPGTYVALHLVFEDLSAVLPNGQVLPGAAELLPTRIQLGSPLTLPGHGSERFVLRHRNSLTLQPSSGEVHWNPEFEARSLEFHPLFDLHARIDFTDPDSRSATATVPAWTDAVVRLEFDEAVSLRLRNRTVSAADFASVVQPGTELRLDGVAWDGRVISVLAASDEVPAPAPGPDIVITGGPSKVTGIITRLAGPDSFELFVTGVHNAGDGFPAEVPLELLVHVDGQGSITWTPQHRPSSGPGGFEALTRRMLVDVQWDGPTVGRTVTADVIEIRAADRSRLRSAWNGKIDAIDLSAGTLTLRGTPEPGSPWVPSPGGGYILPPLFLNIFAIDVLPDSVIVRQSLSQLFMPVELDDRLLGQRVIVLVDNLDSRTRAVLLITP